jgi:hypothetical protein
VHIADPEMHSLKSYDSQGKRGKQTSNHHIAGQIRLFTTSTLHATYVPKNCFNKIWIVKISLIENKRCCVVFAEKGHCLWREYRGPAEPAASCDARARVPTRSLSGRGQLRARTAFGLAGCQPESKSGLTPRRPPLPGWRASRAGEPRRPARPRPPGRLGKESSPSQKRRLRVTLSMPPETQARRRNSRPSANVAQCRHSHGDVHTGKRCRDLHHSSPVSLLLTTPSISSSSRIAALSLTHSP